ncbi:MAG: hypothetical protein Q8M83_00015 [bacterium]|nr:hypothetical protein [bacterium]
MSTSTETTKTDEPSLAKTILALVRYYLGGRRGLILLTVAALGAGLFLNWGWLVAVGVAPLLLALAPCAAMCALGLCMNKMGGKSCSTQSRQADQSTGTNASSTNTTAKVHDEPLAAAIEPALSRNNATHERN